MTRASISALSIAAFSSWMFFLVSAEMIEDSLVFLFYLSSSESTAYVSIFFEKRALGRVDMRSFLCSSRCAR